jgi:hypothetical protein
MNDNPAATVPTTVAVTVFDDSSAIESCNSGG